MADCAKIAKSAEPKIRTAEDAKRVKLKTEAETAFRGCFQEKAKAHEGFSTAGLQASGLVVAMAGKWPIGG